MLGSDRLGFRDLARWHRRRRGLCGAEFGWLLLARYGWLSLARFGWRRVWVAAGLSSMGFKSF